MREFLQGRKDARSRQAGARFARRFVLLVPMGMALAGLGIGNGRAAYQTGAGQAAVVVALAMIGGCWWWAGRIMRLPDEERIFLGSERATERRGSVVGSGVAGIGSGGSFVGIARVGRAGRGPARSPWRFR